MRALILASMATLVLSGLPPAPIESLPAQPAAARVREDPDSICRPFIRGFSEADSDYRAGRGRGRIGAQAGYGAPPPPPPPPAPPPPPMAEQRAARDQALVTGEPLA